VAIDFATGEPLRGAADLSVLDGAFDAGALEGVTVTCFAAVVPVCLSGAAASRAGAAAACFEGVAPGLADVAPVFGSVPVTRFGGVPAARLPFTFDGARSLVMRSVRPVSTEVWTSPFQRLMSAALTP